TPPTTPATPEVGGGSSSSLMVATSFGTTLGAISLPASNWRGITFTTFTGACAAGGVGGGGGGGGATRKLCNVAEGSISNHQRGITMATRIITIWMAKATRTVQPFLVVEVPTNVCS